MALILNTSYNGLVKKASGLLFNKKVNFTPEDVVNTAYLETKTFDISYTHLRRAVNLLLKQTDCQPPQPDQFVKSDFFTCRHCGIHKPEHAFYKRKDRSEYRLPKCKKCMRLIEREYRKQNRDDINARARKNYKNNPSYRETRHKRNVKYSQNLSETYIKDLLRGQSIPLTKENIENKRAYLIQLRNLKLIAGGVILNSKTPTE